LPFFYKFALCLNLIFQNPLESGTDEAGRGCLAGPHAGDPSTDFKNTILNDAKQLSEKTREITSIIEQQAITFVDSSRAFKLTASIS
jgi:ribonuclease HII